MKSGFFDRRRDFYEWSIKSSIWKVMRMPSRHYTESGPQPGRANRAIAPPPKFSQIWCHSHTSHEKLFLETALPLLELLLKTTLSHTCCVILDKTINQSMYHATENSQHRTRDKLWGASYEVKPVPSPRGALVGLSPQVKLQAPQNWNMKSYKSMQLLTTLNVKPTSAQT